MSYYKVTDEVDDSEAAILDLGNTSLIKLLREYLAKRLLGAAFNGITPEDIESIITQFLQSSEPDPSLLELVNEFLESEECSHALEDLDATLYSAKKKKLKVAICSFDNINLIMIQNLLLRLNLKNRDGVAIITGQISKDELGGTDKLSMDHIYGGLLELYPDIKVKPPLPNSKKNLRQISIINKEGKKEKIWVHKDKLEQKIKNLSVLKETKDKDRLYEILVEKLDNLKKSFTITINVIPDISNNEQLKPEPPQDQLAPTKTIDANNEALKNGEPDKTINSPSQQTAIEPPNTTQNSENHAINIAESAKKEPVSIVELKPQLDQIASSVITPQQSSKSQTQDVELTPSSINADANKTVPTPQKTLHQSNENDRKTVQELVYQTADKIKHSLEEGIREMPIVRRPEKLTSKDIQTSMDKDIDIHTERKLR